MSSIQCTNCHLEVLPGEAWCRHCGAKLSFPQPRPDSLSRPGSNQWGGPGGSAIPEYGLPRAAPSIAYNARFGEGGGVWRDGNTLVMLKTARLPDRCIKCGLPANGSHLRKKLTWHHPALVLLVLAGVFIYLIVALIVRKTATVEISLCEDHVRKHRVAVTVSWMIFLLGIVLMILSISAESLGTAGFGMLLLFASAICAGTWVKVVQVKKIDDNYIWLRGVDESFLVLLPSVYEQR
jgi:hypothetical protein